MVEEGIRSDDVDGRAIKSRGGNGGRIWMVNTLFKGGKMRGPSEAAPPSVSSVGFSITTCTWESSPSPIHLNNIFFLTFLPHEFSL